MTLLWCDGFDHYGTDTSVMIEGPYDQVDSDFSLSTSNPRTGKRSLRRSSAPSSSIVLKNIGSAQTALGVGSALYLDSMPNNYGSYRLMDFRDQDETVQFTIYAETDGSLAVRLSERSSLVGRTRTGVITSGGNVHFEVAAIPDSESIFELSGFCGDIGAMSYDGLNKDVSAQTLFPWDIGMKPDGTKAIVHTKFGTPNLFQYSLSNAFDISSASYDSISKSVGVQSDEPHGMHIISAGTRLYISDDGANGTDTGVTPGIYQYDLSSWNLSTLSYSGNSIPVPPGFIGFFDVSLSPDGTTMFALLHSGLEVGKTIIEYELSTPYELNTAVETGVRFDLSPQLSDAHSIELSSSGRDLYVLSRLGNTFFQYELSTPFMLATTEYTGTAFSVSGQSSDAHGFAINENDGSIYVVDSTTDTIYQYSIDCYLTVSNGFIEIRVNGVTELSLSNAKTTFTDNKEYSYVAMHCGSDGDHGVVTDVDDFYIWNGSGAWNNSFLGDRRCYLLRPNQDTNISDFDPSQGLFGYKMIDDESPDDDSTYIIAEAYLQSGSPLMGTSEFGIEEIDNGSSLISAVNVFARSSKTDETSAEFYTSIISGADSVSAPAHTLTTSYNYYSDIFEYSPSTIASLTRDVINSLSISVTADDMGFEDTFISPDVISSPTDDFAPTDYDARYLMNEATGSPTLIDETGSFNGTTNTITSVTGVENTALRTTGASPSRINVSGIPTDPTIFALSGWCRVPSSTGQHFMLAHRDDPTALLQLSISNGLLVYQARSSTSSLITLNSESAIIGSFFHFVLNWNKTGTTEVWINGVLIYEDATNFSGNFSSTLSLVGPFFDMAFRYTSATAGESDLYTVWRNRNLSPSEIAAIYAAESP